MRKTAFLSIAAAGSNLGDIFIRRTVTRLIAAHSLDAVVYTGALGKSYVDAFELPGNWVVTSSPRTFLGALLKVSLKREALVIMAPAPAHLDLRGAQLIKRLGVAFLLVLTRIAGNSVAVLGRALRGSSRVSLTAERAIAGLVRSTSPGIR